MCKVLTFMSMFKSQHLCQGSLNFEGMLQVKQAIETEIDSELSDSEWIGFGKKRQGFLELKQAKYDTNSEPILF